MIANQAESAQRIRDNIDKMADMVETDPHSMDLDFECQCDLTAIVRLLRQVHGTLATVSDEMIIARYWPMP